MPKFSINALAGMTGKTRATIRARLDGLPFDDGGKDGKLYDSKIALEKIYGTAGENGAALTNAEAQRQLTIARRQQIDLEMEVTRKQRIPLDVLDTINERVFSNVAGIIKASKLADQDKQDIFTELRGIGESLRAETA